MKFKLLLVFVLILLVIPLASSTLEDKVQECYNLDDTSGTTPKAEIDEANNGTLNTNSYSLTHKLGTGSVLKDASVLQTKPGTTVKEIRFWYYRETGSLNYFVNGDSSTRTYFWFESNGQLKYYDSITRTTTTYLNDDEWYMITISDIDFSSNTYSVLINNVAVITNETMRNGNGNDGVLNMDVGGNAYIDDIAIFNQTLTSAERAEDYNSGTGTECPFTTTPPPSKNTTFFDLSAFEIDGVTAINNFNATINGTFYSTTNGTINTMLNQSEGTIINFTVNAENFFSQSFINYNSSSDLQVNMSKYPLLGLYNLWNSSGLYNWSYIIDGITYSDSNNGFVYVDVNKSSVEINLTKGNYIFKSLSGNILPDNSYNYSLFQSNLTINAFEKMTNNQINSSWNVIDNLGRVWNLSSNNIYLYPNLDVYSWNFTFSNYYDQSDVSVNVSSVLSSFNLTGVYNSVVTLNFYNFTLFNYSQLYPDNPSCVAAGLTWDAGDNLCLGQRVINNLSGEVNQFTEGFVESFSSVGNSTTINLLKGYEYSFYLNGSPDYTESHNSNTFLKTLNESTHSYNWTLFRDNSLIIDFSDILTNQDVLGVSLLLYGNSSNYLLFANQTPFSYFIGLDSGTYTLLANKSGYTDFSATTNIYDGSLTNVSASITGEATEVSIFVRNIFDQYLSGVNVEIYRATDDSFVSSGFTDSSGGIKFALSDRIIYDVYFVKEGYNNLSGTLSVADTTYTFTMIPSETFNPSYYTGISVSFSPLSNLVNNGTVYNFSAGFTSTWWNVSGMKLYSYQGVYLANTSLPVDDVGAGSFTSSSGTYIISNINASDITNTYYTLRLILTLDDGTEISYYKNYFLDLTFKGDSSLAVALEAVAEFDGAGFGDDDRFFWYVVFMLVITFGAASVGNFVSEPEKILLLLTILSAIGSLFGFLTIGWGSFSEGWFLTTLLGVAALFTLINKKGGS